MSMYGVNAGVPKTLVRHIVRYEADTAQSLALRRVLLDILDTPVSPELLPATETGEIAQQTESLVGPYRAARLLPLLCASLRLRTGENLPAGADRICREIPRRDAAALAEKLLPPLLHPAVQAQLPAQTVRRSAPSRSRRAATGVCRATPAAVWQAELEKLH